MNEKKNFKIIMEIDIPDAFVFPGEYKHLVKKGKNINKIDKEKKDD